MCHLGWGESFLFDDLLTIRPFSYVLVSQYHGQVIKLLGNTIPRFLIMGSWG